MLLHLLRPLCAEVVEQVQLRTEGHPVLVAVPDERTNANARTGRQAGKQADGRTDTDTERQAGRRADGRGVVSGMALGRDCTAAHLNSNHDVHATTTATTKMLRRRKDDDVRNDNDDSKTTTTTATTKMTTTTAAAKTTVTHTSSAVLNLSSTPHFFLQEPILLVTVVSSGNSGLSISKLVQLARSVAASCVTSSSCSSQPLSSSKMAWRW